VGRNSSIFRRVESRRILCAGAPFGFRSLYGKPGFEQSSITFGVFHFNGPAVKLHYFLADAEPQACAFLSFGPFVSSAMETLEDLVSVLRVDPCARVLNGDFDSRETVLLDSGGFDCDSAFSGSELDGVGHEIVHELSDSRYVTLYFGQSRVKFRLKRYFFGCGEKSHVLD
jgi:hypothetical protein